MMIRRQKTHQRATNNGSPSDSTTVLTFSDHIGELRRRVMWVALVFVIASSVAYSYRDILMQVIMAPLEGEKLIYLTPGGGFSFILQITMYAGMLAAAPTLLYQLYKFIQPALPMHARRSAFKVVCFAVTLMLGGIAYGYLVAIPSALHFLNTFAGDDVLPSLTADSYLSFFLAYIGGLGVLFLLPLILMFWHWVKPLGPGGLLKSERWVILLAFVAAALITPTPDVVNQAMIAVPLILIYQFGVVAVSISIMRERRSLRRARKQILAPSAVTDVRPEVQPAPKTPEVGAPLTDWPSAPYVSPSPPAVIAPSQPRRSLDGFTVARPAPRPITLQRPMARRATPPKRPLQPLRVNGSMPRRISIDGVSVV